MQRLTCKIHTHISVFYFSAISRYIALKLLQNIYSLIINSQKIIDLHRSKVKVTGTVHRFLKVQSYHKNWDTENFQYFFCRQLFVCPIKWNNKTRARREMTSQKYVNIWRLTCKTPIPKLLFLIKSFTKIWKIWQLYSLVLLILHNSVPSLVTIGRYLTSFLTCMTFNM